MEALASRIESRDAQVAKRFDKVTLRLDTVENSRAPERGRNRPNVTFIDIPTGEHVEEPEDDELMREQGNTQSGDQPRSRENRKSGQRLSMELLRGKITWHNSRS